MKNLVLLVFVLFVVNLSAQVEATTSDGKIVLLNSDGTWKYKETPTEAPPVSFDCASLIQENKDKMTGSTSHLMKDYLLVSDDGGRTGFAVNAFYVQGSLILQFTVAGAGNCIDEKDEGIFLFRDGTKVSYTSSGKFNCKGKYTLYFSRDFLPKKKLEPFKTKEIATVRIWTSDGYLERDFTTEQSQVLMNSIRCLLGE